MMTCEQAQERLELLFGAHPLPDNLVEHLHGCATCRAFQDDLAELEQRFGTDADFVLSENEENFVVHAVESRTGQSKTVGTTSHAWFRPLLRVAAVVLIAITSYGTYQLGIERGSSESSYSTPEVTPQYGSLASLYMSDEEVEMDDKMITVLIDDYSDSYFESGEVLLGDITAEELEYLLDNFEVGELL